jgi:site-specific recombinase XerD
MKKKIKRGKGVRHKTKLGLPDLENAKSTVLVSLRSPESQRSYRHSINEFVAWYCSARDRAILGLLLGCGLRRRELTELTVDHLQRREDHWAIVDLVGKGGHIRTIPVPDWVKQTIDEWMVASGVTGGRMFRRVCRSGMIWGTEMTEKVVWHVVKQYAGLIGISKLAPHDLRRSCARLCHSAGGELEQIQFLLGHVSVQTTEKYLGCKQRLREAVNDEIGIEPSP